MRKDMCHFLECSYLGKEGKGMGFLDSRPSDGLATLMSLKNKH